MGFAIILLSFLVVTFGYHKTSTMRHKINVLRKKKEISIKTEDEFIPIISPLDLQTLQKKEEVFEA